MSQLDTALAPATSPDRGSSGVYDFRRPTTFAREHVRSLAVAHEVFVRRFASGLNNALRTVVQMEPLSVAQMSFDDYVRSMPNPAVLATVGLDPLPAAAVFEMNVQLALVLVDRMLGGQGLPVPPRRPTDVETHLLHALVSNGLEAFGEALRPLVEVTPRVIDVDYNPQLVQVVAPSEVVLLLTYRVTIAQGARSEGLITICYPYSTLGPVLAQLTRNLWLNQPQASDLGSAAPILRSRVPELPVRLTVEVDPVDVPAGDLAALEPGMVLRLDHRADEPLRGVVNGTDVVAGHLGRRGRRLAFQVAGWRARRSTGPDPAPGPGDAPPPDRLADLTAAEPDLESVR